MAEELGCPSRHGHLLSVILFYILLRWSFNLLINNIIVELIELVEFLEVREDSQKELFAIISVLV